MTARNSQPDRLEELMAEVQRLERAGAFDRTPVDPAALLEAAMGKPQRRRVHRLFVALQAAACLALVIGVASLWRGTGPAKVTDNGSSAARLVASCTDVGSLAQCFTGPSAGRLATGCECVDFDADGDVDLADYGAFQRDHSASR